MMQKLTLLFLLLFLPLLSSAQQKIKLNAWVEGEVYYASDNSHYYYNELHRNKVGWNVGLNNMNALASIELNSNFSVNIRAQFSKNNGDVFNQFNLPLANLKYSNSKKNFSLSLGRSITTFGAFSSLQHPKERIFINLPLAYSYYMNISSAFGFNENMGQNDFLINDEIDWGTTLIYYGAYSDGLLFDWNFKPDKANLKIAITNHAPNIFNGKKIKFRNYGISARLTLQPKVYWEQGVSLSHGSFFKKMYGDIDFSNLTLNQTLIGTDFKVGFGFWEIFGELIGGVYSVPVLTFPDLEVQDENKYLGTFSATLNFKYELPSVSGLYVAYGLDYISFGKSKNINTVDSSMSWDENVLRHQIGMGYKLSEYLLLRSNFMMQPNRDASTADDKILSWRTSLTVYF